MIITKKIVYVFTESINVSDKLTFYNFIDTSGNAVLWSDITSMNLSFKLYHVLALYYQCPHAFEKQASASIGHLKWLFPADFHLEFEYKNIPSFSGHGSWGRYFALLIENDKFFFIIVLHAGDIID